MPGAESLASALRRRAGFKAMFDLGGGGPAAGRRTPAGQHVIVQCDSDRTGFLYLAGTG